MFEPLILEYKTVTKNTKLKLCPDKDERRVLNMYIDDEFVMKIFADELEKYLTKYSVKLCKETLRSLHV